MKAAASVRGFRGLAFWADLGFIERNMFFGGPKNSPKCRKMDEIPFFVRPCTFPAPRVKDSLSVASLGAEALMLVEHDYFNWAARAAVFLISIGLSE